MDILLLWLVFSVIPAVSNLLAFVLIFSFILSFAIGIPYMFSYDTGKGDFGKGVDSILKKIAKAKYIIPFIFLMFLSAVTPNTDQMKLIIGGYFAINTAEYVSEIEGAEKLPENIVNAINKFLEENKSEQ